MNIREAKEEIGKAVKAYTARTEAGSLRIPLKRQRPLLLIGPPGIGKTAVVEQIARECGIGLVAYTMTHHTRQSAIGLPVLEQREFNGESCTVTAYTMSEIIASVYGQMEKSGCREGILFLDEINCVSETLMPAMLQFLQYKTFGSHRLPEGWVIAAAGNPPAYNRSVREFDAVTLDRVRCLHIKPDWNVWKEYAVERGLHPAVLSFLELRPERFYVMEPGRAGFVTGRAWEDLSEILLTMEELGLGVEEGLSGQYLQDEETALEFTFYYRVYEKWKKRLRPEQILKGGAKELERELPALPFDERLCIVWQLLQRLLSMAARMDGQRRLSDSLGYFAAGLPGAEAEGAAACAGEKETAGDPDAERLQTAVRERLESRRRGLAVRKENGLLAPGEEERERKLAEILRVCQEKLRLSGRMDIFAQTSRREAEKAEEQEKEVASSIENTAAFVRRAFGEGQELVVFLTGLSEHSACRELIRRRLPELEEQSEALLFADRREEELRKRLED